LKDAETMGA